MPETVVTEGGLQLAVAPAGPADHAEIFAMWAGVVNEGGVFPRRPPLTDSEFRGAWLQGPTIVVAARAHGRLAGSYCLRPAFPGLAAHIANAGYMVAPDLRRRGIGAALGGGRLWEVISHEWQITAPRSRRGRKTELDAEEIDRLMTSGKTAKEIAAMYGVQRRRRSTSSARRESGKSNEIRPESSE